ncbi:sushi, von Willebrand factor type A, EGF and pentraxin domain-containing protein 1-like [Ictalurus furcatus]|uniref:sushi, von Willebrand factor type A, EGF and pentraxin domain-containing protein 1-like n=1 Tax=Ictalurus furcatus TaxID=66913 RepID=UPI002350642C|nr:sushi, von Willebrand factor type A, EGF and pentraxin domain-containing protein 1-like [Ictalurus furcatus]
MPFSCPAGTYTNLTGQIKCTLCHAGYYCPESTSNYTKFPCPPGFYCPDGTRHATQFPCPRGYYNPEPMTQSLDSCLPCLPGHYCEKERLTAVSGKCKAGWFCVSAAWNPQPFDLDNYTSANCLCPASSTGGRCQAGYFCPAGSSEPIPCLPGAFCNAIGLALPSGPCAAGYYCTGEATQSKPTDGITGDICPPGSYCAEGSSEPEPCPVGTFSAVAGLKHRSQCQSCRAGHYCSTRGLRAPTAPCSQGYWCPPGQTDDLALPCPLGHQCPLGSPAPVLCPSGTYQDKQKQANCTVCEEGFYCDESFGINNVSVLQSCPKGYYCPKGTRYATQFPCPVGSYNQKEGMVSLNSCLLCPVGHFCPFAGLAEPAGLCMPGYWCREGSHSASPSAGSTGSLCPVGHYCPKGTTSPLACPLGTLSNSTGQRSEDDCQPCPGGFYCASTALSLPTGLCSEGFYCIEKAATPMPTDGTSGNMCPHGHYCPNGSTQPLPCDLGTFMSATQASQCWPCTAGWYCVDGARLPCPQG